MAEFHTYRDYMVRATAADGMVRAFAATTRDTVERAKTLHGTYPTATAALGRLLTAGLLMGSDMKDEADLLTLRVTCDGPIRGLLVTADRNGNVKGFPTNPQVDLPASPKGKLDVGGALGKGVLSVIKDIGLKNPYVGQTDLVSGEIAEDVANYYAVSEQIPSVVALGVLMDKDNTVRQAGGFILQLMPGAESDEALIENLEKKIAGLDSMTAMLDAGMSPEDILGLLLGDLGLSIGGRQDCAYTCDCSEDRVGRALLSIGKKDLLEILIEGEDVDMECHFCKKKYVFTCDRIKEMLDEARKKNS